MLLLGLACSLNTTVAQPLDSVPPPSSPWLFLGVYGGFSLITYDVFLAPSVFNTRANIPGTSTFTTGDGIGALAGLLVEVPLSETFNIGFRGGYQLHSGKMEQTYVNNTPDVRGQDGLQVPATVRGTVEPKFGHVSLTPYVRVAPFSFPVYFYGGPTILLPAQARYTYNESILSPLGARFQDAAGQGRGTRNLGNRDFDNATMVLAVSAGAGYEFEFSPEFRLFVEAQYQPTLGDFLEPLRANERWTASTLSGVLGFRYGLGAGAEEPPPPPPVIVSRDTIAPSRGDTSRFAAGAVTPEGLSDTITISRRQVKATEVHALLPYIFFDRDSAVIPARYVRIDPRARRDFRVERLPRGGTLDLYYNLLNIVGARVRDERIPDITLTGCISQFEEDSTLALRRAEAVRDYLTSVWRIPERRIKIVTRGLPLNPSLSEVDTAEAARENQRVEISSSGYQVERPVELPDTTFLAPVGIVRFIPPATADTSGQIDSWALDVMIGDSLIRRAVTGVGAPPRQIDYQIENRPDLDLRGPVTVSSTLVIRDTLYQDLARIQSQPVVVQREGEYEEIRNVVGGKYVDTYNLLLFSFDSSYATSFTQQASPLMKNSIAPNSTVRIIGHTDRIGLPYYNQRLSQQRAEYAAQLLNIQPQEVVGRGEKELLYDNSFPEGRYYSRTVTVVVETPISGEPNDAETSSR